MYTIEEINKALYEACSGIDVEQNQEIVIQSKDAYYVYCFAVEVKDANIEKLQQVIIDNKDCQYAYWFAKDIKKANIQKLSEVVFNSGNISYIKLFYRRIPHDKFDVSRFETYLTFM